MELPEMNESPATASASGRDVPSPEAMAVRPAAGAVALQACPTCGGAHAVNSGAAVTPSYVYAVGRIDPRFPRPSVEKEFAQATGKAQTAGLTDPEATKKVLSQPENRYLIRQLCWVMTIEELDTYILMPRDPADFALLV